MSLLLNFDRPGNFEWAVNLLNSAKPVALPTETVYGLAARLDLMDGVASVFRLKNRPSFDPLIVHVLTIESVLDISKNLSGIHQTLMKEFWPGPLTLLVERNERVRDLVTAGSDFVAIRSPQHPLFRRVLEALPYPYLVAPSANRFTSVSPTCAQDVMLELGPHGLEAVVDGGNCSIGLESTVVRVNRESGRPVIEILRPGAISVEALAQCLGNTAVIKINQSGTGVVASPGTHVLHYSPGVPAFYFESVETLRAALPTLAIRDLLLVEVLKGSMREFYSLGWQNILSLGASSNEAAQNVFRTLRRIADDKPKGFVAVGTTPSGLGLAINDRLRRAAGRA